MPPLRVERQQLHRDEAHREHADVHRRRGDDAQRVEADRDERREEPGEPREPRGQPEPRRPHDRRERLRREQPGEREEHRETAARDEGAPEQHAGRQPPLEGEHRHRAYRYRRAERHPAGPPELVREEEREAVRRELGERDDEHRDVLVVPPEGQLAREEDHAVVREGGREPDDRERRREAPHRRRPEEPRDLPGEAGRGVRLAREADAEPRRDEVRLAVVGGEVLEDALRLGGAVVHHEEARALREEEVGEERDEGGEGAHPDEHAPRLAPQRPREEALHDRAERPEALDERQLQRAALHREELGVERHADVEAADAEAAERAREAEDPRVRAEAGERAEEGGEAHADREGPAAADRVRAEAEERGPEEHPEEHARGDAGDREVAAVEGLLDGLRHEGDEEDLHRVRHEGDAARDEDAELVLAEADGLDELLDGELGLARGGPRGRAGRGAGGPRGLAAGAVGGVHCRCGEYWER